VTTALLRPSVTASVDQPGVLTGKADAPVKVVGGDVTLDALAVPYAQGTLDVPYDDATILDGADPRDPVRVLINAGDEIAGTVRAFNLGLRRREVDHVSKVITCAVESDEAILTDYAPLTPDPTGPRLYEKSLRGLVGYVLARATGALTQYPVPSPTLAGWTGYSDTGGVLQTIYVAPNQAQTTLISGTPAWFGFRTNLAPAKAGETYSGRARLSANKVTTLLARVDYYDAGGVIISSAPSVQLAGVSAADLVTPAHVAPAGTTQARIVVRIQAAEAVGTWLRASFAAFGRGDYPPAILAAGTTDADVTAAWTISNAVNNALADTTAGYTAGTNATGLVTEASQVPIPLGAAYLIYRNASASTQQATLNIAGSLSVKPWDGVTASAWLNTPHNVRAGILVRFFDADGVAILDTTANTGAMTINTWTRLSYVSIAPYGAVKATMFIQMFPQTATTNQALRVDAPMLYADDELVPAFSGASAADALYTYGYSGTALGSPSVRTPILERAPEMFSWTVGVTAWDFLEPFTTQASLRLFCDEARIWRLIDPYTYTVPGAVAFAPTNLTEGTDTIARDDVEVFATGVVVRYTWTDPRTGEQRRQYDVAGEPQKVLVVDYARAPSGKGAAAAILKRRNGKGRTQAVTALVNWTATPAQLASISLPAAPMQQGPIVSVRFALDDSALMDVGTAGLADLPAGSIDALLGTIDNLAGTIDALAAT
jgi:hypothetical protein